MSESHFRVLASKFKELHGISYVIGAIDGLYIPVLALVVGGEDYYCRESFHSTILQFVVGSDCMFWNYKVGWAKSLHIRAVFHVTKLERTYIEGKFHPYKIMGDIVYLVRP